jgi:hypothetical protein
MRVTVSRQQIVDATPCADLDLDPATFGPATVVDGDAITFEFEELAARKPVAANFLVLHGLVPIGFAEWQRIRKSVGLNTEQVKADLARYKRP